MSSLFTLMSVVVLTTILAPTEGVCKTGALTATEQAVLDAHNNLRSLHVDTEPLCYGVSGDDVTFTSQAWSETQAANQAMQHSTGGSFGENLATAGSTSSVMGKTEAYNHATQMWYDEIEFWDFTTSTKKVTAPANKPTGHFTQVVWKNSRQLNCGYATFEKENNGLTFYNYLVTCQYYPPGNYNNQYSTQVAPLGTSVPTTTCSKPVIENASLDPDTATIEEGQTYTVTCAAEHILEGDTNTLACGSDGNLTPAVITCVAERKTCSKPILDYATIIPETAAIEEGQQYAVTCAEGYVIQGDVDALVCGSDGNLTPISVTCTEQTKCSKPAVTNAVITPNSTTITAGGVYTVKCNEEFKMKGDASEMTCEEDGSLTPASLECEKSGAQRLRTVTPLVFLIFVIIATHLHQCLS